jgi:ribonuclease J
MARIRFFGGVGVIGGSRILIEEDGHRVLLDIGQDYRPGRGLMRPPAGYREERELEDRLRVGDAPRIERLYRPDLVGASGLPSGADGRTAVFVTHGHIDHAGLAAFVDPAIPLYASLDTVRLEADLAASGEAAAGERAAFQALEAGSAVSVGPLRVTRLDVDHDVPGASGYLVESPTGRLAYTGDFRLHGRHPERSQAFARAAAGVDVLVIEGTTLGAPPNQRVRTEAQVDQAFAEALTTVDGLVLLALYPRNLERVAAFLAIAQSAGREILWPPGAAAFLAACGLAAASWQTLGAAHIARDRARYVVAVGSRDLPLLLDLPLGPKSAYLHANGEPLGAFDPAWELLMEWLGHLAVPFRDIGTGGHATADDLAWTVNSVAPRAVFPLHTQAPERLFPAAGGVRRLAHYDRLYALGGDQPAVPL